MKFQPINMFKGLVKEFRRIRWIHGDILWPMTFIVIGFIAAFAIFFVSIDALINWALKLFKIIN